MRPLGQPLRLLLQRVGDDRDPATAHLDLACDDREAEVGRHLGLGAAMVRRDEHFSVLRDPTGATYCVTDRSVDTGLLT